LTVRATVTTVQPMAAVRLLLAAIVCSAAAPATAAMAERVAPCRWCCDGSPVDVDAPLTLPGAVREALAGSASQVTAAVWAAQRCRRRRGCRCASHALRDRRAAAGRRGAAARAQDLAADVIDAR
jgi:hypothetical protein